ncbi:gamma-secretase subunit [Heterostelium album PN500]|uniref:Gamma-secretase subunit n=1 Tax=Heterostelium pallidum (strain ATCC 26659 / Pp 5 / PN500) TaxID=670386 RepID=D3B8C1_HETP5|nr:gamma-secretase subunit [Heterostelium album PN500]EFA82289.1 gamma-secretase subunit [Heterostelium album PN500]|eukprot:XP_020434406.1 gamma-secretase subunit [Heterostelium album PN500]
MLVDEDDKLNDEKMRGIARKLWIAGFFFLPWVWMINILFFLPHRKVLSPAIIWYLKYSLIGFFVYTGIFMTWMGIYLVNRNKWGAFGDSISITVPFG